MPSFQPAGNYYDKYGTRNPIARRLMRGFLDSFDRLTNEIPPSGALEVGCGEGELSMRLARRGFDVAGCDVSGDIVEEARRRSAASGLDIKFWQQDLRSLTAADAAPFVVCCEVLEHLDDPREGLDALASLARPYLLTSVPREPVWRAMNMMRGKYLSQWGNTPGHVNHWSQRSFLSFLAVRFEVIRWASPLPWTMALCRLK